ncbi:hypothetical protein LX73_1136 [Fodinibius salinus]|uniref:Uncharacterized protein n=1 Tax=Fodinibius salinus TaxID=860790 RepID=A0A5D3YIN5_9BACT|nr:hypothetical protein [Fodinibius salinus]TYP93432.1 hypothetical protein LX73_1136 [Fodinibius salinus]
MKKKILSVIGAIWGAGIIINWFLSNPSNGNTAYESGQIGAVLIGAFLLIFSIYSYFKEPKDSS